jgi:hypothetical protein
MRRPRPEVGDGHRHHVLMRITAALRVGTTSAAAFIDYGNGSELLQMCKRDGIAHRVLVFRCRPDQTVATDGF